MRCFVAVDLDPSLKNKIVKLQQELPSSGVVHVASSNLHFTMKFIGEVDESTTIDIEERLKKILPKFTPFSVTIHGMGVFPSLDYIRVIWLGAPALQPLQKAVNEALIDIGKPEKEGIPHLTLARVKAKNEKLVAYINKHKDVEIGSMSVSHIKLKKSALTPKGPIYEDVKVFELKKNES